MIKVFRTDCDDEFDEYINDRLNPDWVLETLTVRPPKLYDDGTKRWILEGKGDDIFSAEYNEEFVERLGLFNNISIIFEDGTEFKYRKSFGDNAYKIGLEIKEYLENKNTCVLQEDDDYIV